MPQRRSRNRVSFKETENDSISLSDSISETPSFSLRNFGSSDDHTVISTSFSTQYSVEDNLDDENSVNNDGYDDSALSDIISKLKGGMSISINVDSDEEQPQQAQLVPDKDPVSLGGNMTEDTIESHLKVLAQKTKKAPKMYLCDDVSETEGMTDTENWNEGVQDVAEEHVEEDDCDGEEDDDDDDSDDEFAHEIYAEAEDIVKRLGVNSIARENTTDNKKLLEKLSTQGTYDFKGAPQTASSKQQWLATLASDLMAEGEIDDSESLHTMDVNQYERNVAKLQTQAIQAKRLLHGHADLEEHRNLLAELENDKMVRPHLKKPKSSLPSPEHFQRKLTQGSLEMGSGLDVSHHSKRETRPVGAEDDDQVDFDKATLSQSKVQEANKFVNIVQDAILERSQHIPLDTESKDEQSVASKSLVIPSGFPPYPGYGPKWPWHPNSPKAPEGYRETYMHHMGEYYFQYQEYLRTRASNDSVDDTKAEEIMRSSLSSQSEFKAMSYRQNKPKPALSPYTFTSKPGRARRNCPVSLPKIEESMNSSNDSSAAPLEKKIEEKKTKPDKIEKGKHHKKSKGRKGRIVVVSGKELEQKRKEESKKRTKQSSKMAAPETSTLSSKKDTSDHASKKSFPEQPQPTAEQQCACVIM